MRAICLVGSPGVRSCTGVAVRHVAGLLTMRGFDTEVVNLAEARLPPMDPPSYWSGAPHPHQETRNFIDAVALADTVLLGTPVQHGSYSGLLKSALDLLPADAMESKAVGLLANAGGPRGAGQACEHLRGVVKAFGGWSVPTQVLTIVADYDEDRSRLVAETPLRRCRELADQVLTFTKAMRPDPREVKEPGCSSY